MNQAKFILASASPRRVALLETMGIVPDLIVPADIDETPRRGELPRQLALRLAREKAALVVQDHPGAFVLGADTVVATARRVLPKAKDVAEVASCMSLLSGRRHHVFTAIALIDPTGRVWEALSDSCVMFARLEPQTIDAYAQSGEGVGKAGGYAIQGRAAALIKAIRGSYSGIVGLPLFELAKRLRDAGYTP